MRRPVTAITFVSIVVCGALWLLLKTPGTLADVFWNPVQALLGTQRQINSTLLEVSENGEPVRAAGRRLLQPFGGVRLVRTYESADKDHPKKTP